MRRDFPHAVDHLEPLGRRGIDVADHALVHDSPLLVDDLEVVLQLLHGRGGEG